MSNQFSYELDERQIRLIMQDAEADYNETMWNKLEALSIAESKSSAIGNYIPTINLSISRSIIVPIVFVFLIGGLSAMLFSFVDFKKKEVLHKEVPLIANPENFKKPEVKPEPVKQIVTVPTPTISNEVKTTVVEASKTSTSAVAKVKKEIPKAVEPEVKKEVIVAKEVKKETIVQPVRKKKKMKVEELPTINASMNLNESSSPEPELELK